MIGWWIVIGLWAVALIALAIARPSRALFQFSVGMMLLGVGAKWLQGRWIRGTVLIDGGPHPRQKLFLAGLILLVISALLKLFKPEQGVPGGFDFGLAGHLLFIAVMLEKLGARLQFTDRGIWHYEALIHWDDITGYHWTKDGTLEVGRKGPPHLTIPLFVPSARREAVEEALRKHVPALQEPLDA